MLPAAQVFLRHRIPTFHVTRPIGLAAIEPGCKVILYWNGTNAPNGDGVPGFLADVNYETPLMAATEFFPFAPGFPDPDRGWARGPWARGGWAGGYSVFRWTSPFAFRDGTYRVEAWMQDSLGNEVIAESGHVVLRIEALPRPASIFRIAARGETNVDLQWDSSPEFEATA